LGDGAVENVGFDSFLPSPNDSLLSERREYVVPHILNTQKQVQSQSEEFPGANQPTYAKVHRDHLDLDTLHYYDIPYDIDSDPNYLVVLREMNQRETDVLFEHTRRLRASKGRGLFERTEHKGTTYSNPKGSKAQAKGKSRRASDIEKGPSGAEKPVKNSNIEAENTGRTAASAFRTDLDVEDGRRLPRTSHFRTRSHGQAPKPHIQTPQATERNASEHAAPSTGTSSDP
jgi:hypothetical protein